MKIDLEQFKLTVWENIRNSVQLFNAIELMERYGGGLPPDHPARIALTEATVPEIQTDGKRRPKKKARKGKRNTRALIGVRVKAPFEPMWPKSSSKTERSIPQWQFLRNTVGTKSMTTGEIAEAMQAKGWVFKSTNPKQAALQSIYELKRRGYQTKYVPDPSDSTGKRVLWSISPDAAKKTAQLRR